MDNRKRKEARMRAGVTDQLSARGYNIAIGGFTAYGLLLSGILAAFLDGYIENYVAFLVVYFISCFAGIFMAVKSNNPIVSFIGYNFVAVPIGIVVDTCIEGYMATDVAAAFIVTGLITVIMIGVAVIRPETFQGMGRTLFISLIVAIIGELIAMLLGYGGDIFNWAFVVIFSLYLGYDWSTAQMYPKTIDNAIDSALDIYLDIINLFLRLLEILGKKDD